MYHVDLFKEDIHNPNVGKKVRFKFPSLHCKKRKRVREQTGQNITAMLNSKYYV